MFKCNRCAAQRKSRASSVVCPVCKTGELIFDPTLGGDGVHRLTSGPPSLNARLRRRYEEWSESPVHMPLEAAELEALRSRRQQWALLKARAGTDTPATVDERTSPRKLVSMSFSFRTTSHSAKAASCTCLCSAGVSSRHQTSAGRVTHGRVSSLES